ncbi:MAG: hypothetical protein LBP35_00580 [Candidatus Ancillula trichonymphae]|jgi:hypothetical protein|nr:hypothetical protein [Candidatus Ancillula trichonymphae]
MGKEDIKIVSVEAMKNVYSDAYEYTKAIEESIYATYTQIVDKKISYQQAVDVAVAIIYSLNIKKICQRDHPKQFPESWVGCIQLLKTIKYLREDAVYPDKLVLTLY